MDPRELSKCFPSVNNQGQSFLQKDATVDRNVLGGSEQIELDATAGEFANTQQQNQRTNDQNFPGQQFELGGMKLDTIALQTFQNQRKDIPEMLGGGTTVGKQIPNELKISSTFQLPIETPDGQNLSPGQFQTDGMSYNELQKLPESKNLEQQPELVNNKQLQANLLTGEDGINNNELGKKFEASALQTDQIEKQDNLVGQPWKSGNGQEKMNQQAFTDQINTKLKEDINVNTFNKTMISYDDRQLAVEQAPSFGLEVVLRSHAKCIKTSLDFVVIWFHWCLLRNGFTNRGTPQTINDYQSECLPVNLGWNGDKAGYFLKYSKLGLPYGISVKFDENAAKGRTEIGMATLHKCMRFKVSVGDLVDFRTMTYREDRVAAFSSTVQNCLLSPMVPQPPKNISLDMMNYNFIQLPTQINNES